MKGLSLKTWKNQFPTAFLIIVLLNNSDKWLWLTICRVQCLLLLISRHSCKYSLFFPWTGDPALLHHYMCSQNIDMSKIDEIDLESLKNLCQSCGISISNKSKVHAFSNFNTLSNPIILYLLGLSSLPQILSLGHHIAIPTFVCATVDTTEFNRHSIL
jgi:hypothetical protein